MRDRYARIETVDGPATVGDICVIDFLGMIDGEAFDGGSGQNYSLELGSGSFIPGFEDQLIDAKAGDEVPVFVVFPEDYRPEDLAGKEAVFAVTVKEVKRKLLSDMDDEFAKDVSEFETLAELRADLAAKLDKEAKERSQADWESKVVENAAAGAEVALPEGMVSLRADHLMQEFSQRLRQQNLDLDKYLEITGGKLEDAENDMRQRAQDELKTELVLYAVAKAEGLAVSDGDLEEEYARLAGQTDQTVETIKKIYTGSKGMAKSIRENLLMSKTIKRLAELAVATESADAVAAVAAADAEATDLAATAELFEAAAEVADSAEAAAAAIAADLAAAAVPAEAEDLAPAAE
ncbi:MAG: trigger factor, partial [Peptococcaceae bacterium]|jgi:trigger factor|nr:trigger factor [Peptococcaceae bacterium]